MAQLKTYARTIDGVTLNVQLSEAQAQRLGLVGKHAGEPEVTLDPSEDGGSVELTVEASPAEADPEATPADHETVEDDDDPVGAPAKARAPRNKAAKTVETK